MSVFSSTSFRKLRRNILDFGVRGAFVKGVMYLLKPVYADRTYRIYRRELGVEEYPEVRTGGIVLRVVGAGETGALGQIEGMEEWLEGILPGIMSHGLCIGAFDGSRVAGFNLIAFDDVFVRLINLKRRLRPHEAWSEQITVHKDYRKHGLGSALRYRAFAELRQRGIRKFYGGTLASNLPSVKTAEKVGFRFFVDVRYRKLLKWDRRTYRRVKRVSH